MTRMTTGFLALAALLTFGASAEAGVNGRQQCQRDRIARGVASGELTWREASRLSREQRRIQRQEYRFRHNDGRLGVRERAKLNRDLNRSNRHIYRQKHDGQGR
jgi:hypothetical protein